MERKTETNEGVKKLAEFLLEDDYANEEPAPGDDTEPQPELKAEAPAPTATAVESEEDEEEFESEADEASGKDEFHRSVGDFLEALKHLNNALGRSSSRESDMAVVLDACTTHVNSVMLRRKLRLN